MLFIGNTLLTLAKTRPLSALLRRLPPWGELVSASEAVPSLGRRNHAEPQGWSQE